MRPSSGSSGAPSTSWGRRGTGKWGSGASRAGLAGVRLWSRLAGGWDGRGPQVRMLQAKKGYPVQGVRSGVLSKLPRPEAINSGAQGKHERRNVTDGLMEDGRDTGETGNGYLDGRSQHGEAFPYLDGHRGGMLAQEAPGTQNLGVRPVRPTGVTWGFGAEIGRRKAVSDNPWNLKRRRLRLRS